MKTLKELNIKSFTDIPEPRMVGLVSGNGTGSKVFQGFFDGHPNLYMIPAYPLTYFYPHWDLWKSELRDSYTWNNLINKFCEKHGSVIDSRRIPGHNGLRTLGEEQDEHVSIDENMFRTVLKELLEGQEISSRTFLLAVHYTYAICKNEDLNQKTVLFYHIHIFYYLDHLIQDFPELKLLAMTRDQRSSLKGRISSAHNFDVEKLNMTDAIKFQKYLYLTAIKAYSWNLQKISDDVNLDSVRVVRHEDLYYIPDTILQLCCDWIGIPFSKELSEVTFDGKTWWGDKIYNMPPTRGVFKRTVSKEWKNEVSKRDRFLFEGLYWDCYTKYKYNVEFYKKDNTINRILLWLTILLPMQYEVQYLLKILHYKTHVKFIKHASSEAFEKTSLVDYTFNGSYLFKNIYKPLRLWEPVWFRAVWLKFKKSPLKVIRQLGNVIYIVCSYLDFCFSILSYPAVHIYRCAIMYKKLYKRCYTSEIIPELINKNNEAKIL